MADERLRIARTMFVENGKSLAEIAFDLDISIFVLNEASGRENWKQQREDLLKKREEEVAQDSRYLHEHAVRQQINLVMYLTKQLENRDLEPDARRQIRFDLEACRNAAEALSQLVKTDRVIKGIKKDAPSIPDPAKQVTGVKFTIVKPDLSTQSKTG